MLLADLRHMTAGWDDRPARLILRSVPKVLLHGRYRGLLLFRLSQRAPRPIALWLQSRGLRACAADLHPQAVIGPGLNLAHTPGIVIGHEVRAGSDLTIYQGVTLGHGPSGKGQPNIGDRVRIFAGATLLGPITVGDDAVIGAHALVLADVPAGQTVTGVWKG